MDTLLEHLTGLELALQDADTRRQGDRVHSILHPEFTEFGRSGVRYDRESIMSLLSTEEPAGRISSQQFELALLGPETALLTYRSMVTDASGNTQRHTLRSSIYLKTPDGWKLRFHQGTPMARGMES